MMPPWPSVIAGALRSAMLARKGIDMARYAKGEIQDPELGSPDQPGTFVISAFGLARCFPNDGRQRVEVLFQPPADLVIHEHEQCRKVAALQPLDARNHEVQSSAQTSQMATLRQSKRLKPVSGFVLNRRGWQCYLDGKDIDGNHEVLLASELWQSETRVGIGLDGVSRAARESHLFSSEAISFHKTEFATRYSDGGFDAGFYVEVLGAELPEHLVLRFGGDGRAAECFQVEIPIPEPDYEMLARVGRCRLILAAPGIFSKGWLPTGVTGNQRNLKFELRGVRGRLVCAAVPRAEVVSGFDLAKRKPKPALRVAPTGSVYWIEDLEASPEALRNLVEKGLWPEEGWNDTRRAEGFNRVLLAA